MFSGMFLHASRSGKLLKVKILNMILFVKVFICSPFSWICTITNYLSDHWVIIYVDTWRNIKTINLYHPINQ